jgi:hypothetical protein
MIYRSVFWRFQKRTDFWFWEPCPDLDIPRIDVHQCLVLVNGYVFEEVANISDRPNNSGVSWRKLARHMQNYADKWSAGLPWHGPIQGPFKAQKILGRFTTAAHPRPEETSELMGSGAGGRHIKREGPPPSSSTPAIQRGRGGTEEPDELVAQGHPKFSFNSSVTTKSPFFSLICISLGREEENQRLVILGTAPSSSPSCDSSVLFLDRCCSRGIFG